MRVTIGADHGGYPLKAEIASLVSDLSHEVSDVGAHDLDPSDDYPDFAEAVALDVAAERADRGIVICGSGVGAAIVANKIRGVRASVCHDTYSARQGVEHDDMNVLCLGARVAGVALARDIVREFLSARFAAEERYLRRLGKVSALEERWR